MLSARVEVNRRKLRLSIAATLLAERGNEILAEIAWLEAEKLKSNPINKAKGLHQRDNGKKPTAASGAVASALVGMRGREREREEETERE